MGPLSGIRILEFAGIGPGPFCGMLLADLGADVVRVDRPGAVNRPGDLFGRGKRSVAFDLKAAGDRAAVLALIAGADALIEGFRPGVMERLGFGPAEALAINPRLVYGRMTGWGQSGPLAAAAGHDLNYIALTGALHAMGEPGRPPAPPLNLVGDFGGGSLYLAFGLCAALLQARGSGRGQVVDCAMTDGAASLMTLFYGLREAGMWRDERGSNLLDGGAHFYRCYVCADGKFISIAAIEPQFYALLRTKIGLSDSEFDAQYDPAAWPDLGAKIAALIARKTRAEWVELLEGTDACFAPVLSPGEAPAHPHNVARGTFVEAFGVTQPAPAPRFSETPGAIARPPPECGAHTSEVLRDWGASDEIVTGIGDISR